MASYYDPYYYPNYQHRTEISYFTGEDVDGWLSQIENLFYRHQTMSNQKLAVGTFYLAGGALEWYREWYWDMRRSWRTLTWENFVADLRCRFWSESLTRRSVVIESMSKTCEGMIQLLNEMKNQNSVYMSDFSKLKSQLSSISTCGSSANKVEESDLNCELSAADVVSTDCEKFESASVAISKDLDNPKSDEMNSVAVPPRLNWELHKQVSFNTTYGICPQVLNLFNDTLGQPQGDRKCEMLLGDLNGIEHSYSPTVCENDTLVHSRPLRNHFPLALVWNEAGVYDQKETQGFAYLFCALNSHSSSCSPSVCLNVDMDWFSYYAMRTNAIGNQSYILSQKKKVRCDKPPAKPPDDIVIYAATEANIETIWNKVELEDPVENIGAKLVRQAAAKTNDLAGDGTTTVVLAQGLITEGVKVVVAGANPVLITRSIEKTTKALVQELKAISKEVEDSELTDVAAVSAGSNYEVGNMIAEAMSKVGRKGVVTLEEGNSAENSLYVVEGMQFDRGYISPYFVTDSKKMTVEYENCKLLLVDKITNARDLINVLEEAIKGGYPIVIVAEDIEQEALATFVVNKLRGALKIAAFKAHGYMDFGFCDKGVAQLFGYVFVTNDMSSSSNVEFPWIEATLNKWEILFLRIIEDSDVLEFEAEVSAISMEKFMETSPLWDLSIQAIYFIWTAAMTYLTTIMVGMLGEDDLGLLLFTFDHSGVLFLSHENHLLLDSRVGYSALSCVSLVAASLSLSWPIYMSIESEELISPEDRCIQVLSVDIGGPALGLRLEIGRKQKNAEKEVIEGASFCSSFFPTVKHLSVKRHRELRAIIFVTVETHFDLFDTDKKEYELFDIVDMRDDPKSFGKLDYTMQTMEGLLEEAVAVSAISVRISKFLIFSSPRPPEDADLQDKVNLKERGMLRVQISQSLGSLMQYVEGYK